MVGPHKKGVRLKMDGPKNKQIKAALKRAQTAKRPASLTDDGTRVPESLEDDAGFQKPERVEHTSEKEHPPGKE
jgi:uncharacterized protein YfaP (DUF2135 family)